MESVNANNPIEPLSFKTVVLLLLDGWGIAPISEANAITSAKTPTFLNLIKEYPVAVLNTGSKTINARYLSLGAGKDLNDENEEPSVTLNSIISGANLPQIKITETERLAALTHYFNGQREDKYANEDWISVSSDAETDDKKISLKAITKESLKAIKSQKYKFIVISMPTIDLAASTGNFLGVKKTLALLDKSLNKIVNQILLNKQILVISSACGNAEKMLNLGTELADTEITNNPVPFIVVGEEFKGKTIGLADTVDNDLSLLEPVGSLADIAPTILKIIGLDKPLEMSGESLI